MIPGILIFGISLMISGLVIFNIYLPRLYGVDKNKINQWNKLTTLSNLALEIYEEDMSTNDQIKSKDITSWIDLYLKIRKISLSEITEKFSHIFFFLMTAVMYQKKNLFSELTYGPPHPTLFKKPMSDHLFTLQESYSRGNSEELCKSLRDITLLNWYTEKIGRTRAQMGLLRMVGSKYNEIEENEDMLIKFSNDMYNVSQNIIKEKCIVGPLTYYCEKWWKKFLIEKNQDRDAIFLLISLSRIKDLLTNKSVLLDPDINNLQSFSTFLEKLSNNTKNRNYKYICSNLNDITLYSV